MEKNLKRREFLEADKLLCQAVLSGLNVENASPNTIKAFKDWWADINEQLANYAT
jgi:hypothetical protein